MSERELITAAFGNYGNLVAAQYINGTSRYDLEHNVLYFETKRGAKMPRLIMLDHQHPSRIVGELDINKVTYVEEDKKDGGGDDSSETKRSKKDTADAGGYSDPYNSNAFFAQRPDETDRDYAERMYLDDETLDESAFYGGAAIGKRIREQRKKEKAEAKKREREKKLQSQNEGPRLGSSLNATEIAEEGEGRKNENSDHEGSDDEEVDTIPIFNVKDTLVPWYRYIIPPLHRTSYQLMKSSHSDPRGTALLHSFGHGLAAAQSLSSAPSELQHTWDNIRYQLEASDRCQGFQFFVDADGALGGYAHATIRQIHDDYDDEIPIATHALFTPFNIDMVEDDFAKLRKQEVVLNHALSTHYLSTDSSAIYTPYRISEWGDMWGCEYTDDNVATAQMVAAAVDTAFYNTRDPENRLESQTAGSDGYGYGLKPLSAYADAVKPAPSYRICSAYAALPMPMKTRGVKNAPPSFSEFLGDHPLMGVQTTSNKTAATSAPSALTYRPLSHVNSRMANTDAGRVHGQTFTLRGVSHLQDRDFPRLEAVNRLYLYPTQCSRVIATITDAGYAISSTFPPSLLGLPANSDLSALPHTPMGAHYCSTSNATSMLKQLIAEATPIIKYGACSAASPLRDSYGLERDEWEEVLESLHQMRDDYDHNEDNDNGDSDGEF